MDKNFRVRVLCGFGLAAATIASLFTFDGVPFKILFGLFAVVSGIELLSFFKKTAHFKNVILAAAAIFSDVKVRFIVFANMVTNNIIQQDTINPTVMKKSIKLLIVPRTVLRVIFFI